MKRKKILGVLSIGAILGGLISAGMPVDAKADIEAYVIKAGEDIYSYSKYELTEDFLNFKTGNEAELYKDFTVKLKMGNGFHAFKDEKNGFIDYKDIEKNYLDAKTEHKTFSVDKYVESKECKVIEVKWTKKAVIIKEGKVKYETPLDKEEKKSDVVQKDDKKDKEDKQKQEQLKKKQEAKIKAEKEKHEQQEKERQAKMEAEKKKAEQQQKKAEVAEKDGIFGNTIGNSVNNSWVAEDDNYIYLLCGTYSNTYEGYVSKYNKNTKELTKLTDEVTWGISGINVVKDNIYYKNQEQKEDSYVHNLYKMNTNGKNNEKIIEGVEQYIASDKNVYFVSSADNHKLCKTDINGQNKVVITEDPVEFFNVVGDKIVYTKKEREEIHNKFNRKCLGAIYRINLDSSNKTLLTKNDAHNIITVGNEVYYINYSDSNKIYKVSLDGSKDVKVSDNRAEYMNINDGWIYFANESAPKTIYVGASERPTEVGTLYKMKTDGTGSTKLKDEYFRGLNVLKDAVYYNEYLDNGSMNMETTMRIDKDGNNARKCWNYLTGDKDDYNYQDNDESNYGDDDSEDDDNEDDDNEDIDNEDID